MKATPTEHYFMALINCASWMLPACACLQVLPCCQSCCFRRHILGDNTGHVMMSHSTLLCLQEDYWSKVPILVFETCGKVCSRLRACFYSLMFGVASTSLQAMPALCRTASWLCHSMRWSHERAYLAV